HPSVLRVDVRGPAPARRRLRGQLRVRLQARCGRSAVSRRADEPRPPGDRVGIDAPLRKVSPRVDADAPRRREPLLSLRSEAATADPDRSRSLSSRYRRERAAHRPAALLVHGWGHLRLRARSHRWSGARAGVYPVARAPRRRSTATLGPGRRDPGPAVVTVFLARDASLACRGMVGEMMRVWV